MPPKFHKVGRRKAASKKRREREKDELVSRKAEIDAEKLRQSALEAERRESHGKVLQSRGLIGLGLRESLGSGTHGSRKHHTDDADGAGDARSAYAQLLSTLPQKKFQFALAEDDADALEATVTGSKRKASAAAAGSEDEAGSEAEAAAAIAKRKRASSAEGAAAASSETLPAPRGVLTKKEKKKAGAKGKAADDDDGAASDDAAAASSSSMSAAPCPDVFALRYVRDPPPLLHAGVAAAAAEAAATAETAAAKAARALEKAKARSSGSSSAFAAEKKAAKAAAAAAAAASERARALAAAAAVTQSFVPVPGLKLAPEHCGVGDDTASAVQLLASGAAASGAAAGSKAEADGGSEAPLPPGLAYLAR